jgi:hypothetical protein
MPLTARQRDVAGGLVLSKEIRVWSAYKCSKAFALPGRNTYMAGWSQAGILIPARDARLVIDQGVCLRAISKRRCEVQ